jgi:hypothetical protein
MADFNISGRMKVKTLKANFKKEFGSTLRVYNGKRFADDDATIASLVDKKIPTDAEVKANGRTLVSNFIKNMDKIFDITVKITDPRDEKFAPDDISLTDSGKL